MGFFDRLFKKKQTKRADSFEAQQEVQALLTKYKKEAVLLRPHLSSAAIPYTESKFGGEPNLSHFDVYPCCDACGNPLNFVLQLYKKDFPSHYFPEQTNLFQIFRCPNFECSSVYSDESDLKTFVYYFNSDTTENKNLIIPELKATDIEYPSRDCFLKPKLVDDVPSHDDCWSDEIDILDKKYGYQAMENHRPAIGTKSGGYPSYEQNAAYPICDCGRTKEFFFQLSSEDLEDGVISPPSPDKWSPHQIMIGDLGSIYFYVCKPCGSQTIESNWDCG